jgi:hypothetical protein
MPETLLSAMAQWVLPYNNLDLLMVARQNFGM